MIGGLQSKLSKDDLHHYFQRYGAIQDIWMKIPERTYGFVKFVTTDGAANAMKYCPHQISGVNIDVKYADNRKKVQYNN